MNSILIIRGGALGDFIVTLPVCHRLRAQWPEARIDFLGNPAFAELGHRRYYFDGVRSLERGSLARFFVPEARLDEEWRDYFSEFDLIVSYLYDPDDFFHTNLGRCCPGNIVRGDPRVRTGPAARHLGEPLLELGFPLEQFSSRLYPSAEDETHARALLSGYGPKILAFHPGSGSPKKNWPLIYWRELLLQAEQLGYQPLLIAGEAELERLETLKKLTPLHAIGLPLTQLAAIIRLCPLFIGHDSGVTHLAAATGTRTLALFGPTDSTVWAPPGANVTVLCGGEEWDGFELEEVIQKIDT